MHLYVDVPEVDHFSRLPSRKLYTFHIVSLKALPIVHHSKVYFSFHFFSPLYLVIRGRCLKGP